MYSPFVLVVCVLVGLFNDDNSARTPASNLPYPFAIPPVYTVFTPHGRAAEKALGKAPTLGRRAVLTIAAPRTQWPRRLTQTSGVVTTLGIFVYPKSKLLKGKKRTAVSLVISAPALLETLRPGAGLVSQRLRERARFHKSPSCSVRLLVADKSTVARDSKAAR